jgi:hypothetical protein
MECASQDLSEKYFFAEVKRRRNFQNWTSVKSAKVELSWAPMDVIIEPVVGNDDLFLFGGYGPVCAVYSAKTGEILQRWSPAGENEKVDWIDTTLSVDGKHVFMIEGDATESKYLQVRKF